MPALGQSPPRLDAVGKVTGETLYPGDIALPDMLHMKILFAGRPHARIRRIDTSRAEAYPGVVAVFTARDVPVNEYGLSLPDQPVLCGPGSLKIGADTVRFVGDQVALVVGESEAAAMQGRALIQVEYEDLPVLADPRAAMRADAPLLFPERGTNVVGRHRIRKGDVVAGFATAAAIVEEIYQTPFQEHAYLQPEAGVAFMDDEGRVTVQAAGQWTHEDRRQIAHALDLPEEQIRVMYPAIGGAFGGREDMSVQIVLALAAWRLAQRGIQRPVKMIWSREESIAGHHKRHPMWLKAKWGARADGALTAAEVDVIADAGAYASTSREVLAGVTLMSTGPYEIPNVKVDACAVYTNNLPAGAFRGFGAPQGALVAEGQMNRLAEALGLDPVEIRVRNVLTEGALASVGTPFPGGVTIGRVIEQCAREAGWEQANGRWHKPVPPLPVNGDRKDRPVSNSLSAPPPAARRGVGFACGFKNVGFNCGYLDTCWATIELHGDAELERVILHHAGADVGQGAHTAMMQMAAEALGVPGERVELVVSDTAFTGDSGSSSASRMTFMAGNAIRGAARAALEKWRNEDRPAVASYRYEAPETTPFDPETGHSRPNFAYSYVAEAVEVEVDIETGQVRVVSVVCADDAGRVINPQLAQGQIEGGVVQGYGYAVLENFVMENGYIRTPSFSSYLIPTVLDVPERVESVLLEYPDSNGPFGARGMAEVPLIPVAAAIVAAVKDATGVWINTLPLTPDRVLKALRKTGMARYD
ncbi:MAG: molybdopterin-dependent oxidoreductase [Ardenticatenaceae bacterium]|nr:molybdopterin-dependent oxidoreductase [Ardenticatenaceae bacterium]